MEDTQFSWPNTIGVNGDNDPYTNSATMPQFALKESCTKRMASSRKCLSQCCERTNARGFSDRTQQACEKIFRDYCKCETILKARYVYELAAFSNKFFMKETGMYLSLFAFHVELT